VTAHRLAAVGGLVSADLVEADTGEEAAREVHHVVTVEAWARSDPNGQPGDMS
jgi:hypothetical protein